MDHSLTQQLVRLVTKPVDQKDRQTAALHVLDWAGTVIAAQGTVEADILRRYAGISEIGSAHAIGVGRREPLLAAFVNGGLGIILELDDVHRSARLHPGDVVIPAALACAQATAADSGAFLDAVVRGYEVMVRVGESVGVGHYRYWHPTSSCGPFGAAMAAGDLLSLDVESLVHALGNAGTQSAGLWQCRPERTMSKVIHAGHAAQSGLSAANLARLGMTGPTYVLEGPMGLYAAACPDPEPEAVTRPGHTNWKIEETSFKPWPACRHTHPAIDAVIGLEWVGDLDSIRRVEVRTYADALEFADCPQPRDSHEARFSLQHAVAVALLYGEPQLHHFEWAGVHDEAVSLLRSRINVFAAEPYVSQYPEHWGAEVTLTTRDTEQRVVRTDALGDPERALPVEGVIAKADGLFGVAGLDVAHRSSLAEATLALAWGGSLEQFVALLP